MTARIEAGEAQAASGRERWRAVRELLGGGMILIVWLALWAWVAVGVAAPLGHLERTVSVAERVVGA